ncbi:MAG: class II aldolase/adducin family protein [Saprospiraceae bacterium]|nr:class II aldolase/adducin family protein [Saprospiraceae bacterium]
MDEGYIKFDAIWVKTDPFGENDLAQLNTFRQKVFELKLIGAYDNGIGYGNISQRQLPTKNPFYISGSATGNLSELLPTHYALVKDVRIDENQLFCEGPIVASSESMSHAVIYQTLPEVQAVIHVHHLNMWKSLLHSVPTTSQSATYGTPEMAYSIIDLLQSTHLPKTKLFVMEGHEEGVFVFGNSLAEAYAILLEAYLSFST